MNRLLSIVMAALFALSGNSAAAADNIGCMDFTADSEEFALVERFVDDFTMAEFDSDGPPDALMQVLLDRAMSCLDDHAWTEDAAGHATLWKLAQIGERAIRTNYPDIGTTVDRIDTRLDAAEQARLWSIIDSIAGIDETMNEPSDAEHFFLGTMAKKLDPDISEEESEQVGSLLAMMAMKRISREQFEAQ